MNLPLEEKNLTVDEEELKCIKEEKKCKGISVQCISDSHLKYVQDKKRAKELMEYDTLKGVYERKSLAEKLYLCKKLITFKYCESDEMSYQFLTFNKTVLWTEIDRC